MAQTIAGAIWEEGWLQGRSDGQLACAREILRALLADRFGDVPKAVLQRIAAATDVSRLNAAALQVRHMATADDLQL